MRDMYDFYREEPPPSEVRFTCTCGHLIQLDVDPEDHWDTKCPRCHQYHDDTETMEFNEGKLKSVLEEFDAGKIKTVLERMRQVIIEDGTVEK